MADTKPDAPADPKPDAAGGKAKDQKPKSALRTLREWVITFAVVLAILAVGVVYLLVAFDQWAKGSPGMAIAWFGYALANVGLAMAAK